MKRYLKFIFVPVLVLSISLIFTGLSSSNVHAEFQPDLTFRFPTPSAHYKNGNLADNNIGINYSIFSNHGMSPINKFGVYFDSQSGAKWVTIDPVGLTDGQCKDNIEGNGNNGITKIKITVSGVDKTYPNPDGEQICQSRSFPIDNTKLDLDVYSGKWRTDVTVAIVDPISPTLPIGGDDRKFGFYITSVVNNVPGGYIGNINTGDVQTNSFNYRDDGARGYRATSLFSFGLPCDFTNFATPQTVSVYDVDNGQENQNQDVIRVRYRIYEDGVPFAQGQYTDVKPSEQGFEDPNNPSSFYVEPDDGPAVLSQIRIRMVKGKRYVLKIWNVWHSGSNDVAEGIGSNHIAIGLPGDSINGTSAYNCSAYDLKPSVDASPNIIEAGSSVSISSKVDNLGDTDSPQATWELTRSINGGAATQVTPDSTGKRPFPGKAVTPLSDITDDATDLPAGTTIDYVLSVTPHSNTDSGTTYSSPSRVVIAAKPKVQVWGGDLSVGRQFNGAPATGSSKVQTSTSIKGTSTFGSWVEYAIFATGTISGTASGSGFAGGVTTPVNACPVSTLSFANVPADGATCTGASGSIGNYSNASTIPDISTSFPGSVGSLPSPVSLQDPSIASGSYTVGDITLNASTLPANGKFVVIKAPGKTVTIAEDQKYADGPYANISELPQLVIIADKIVIKNNVSQIDAWLIAKNNGGTGEIDTCGDFDGTAAKCNKVLKVNGPVMTQRLRLRRTGGATVGDAAEIFNLRPDVYLWAYNHFYGKGAIRTVYSTELPPRL